MLIGFWHFVLNLRLENYSNVEQRRRLNPRQLGRMRKNCGELRADLIKRIRLKLWKLKWSNAKRMMEVWILILHGRNFSWLILKGYHRKWWIWSNLALNSFDKGFSENGLWLYVIINGPFTCMFCSLDTEQDSIMFQVISFTPHKFRNFKN